MSHFHKALKIKALQNLFQDHRGKKYIPLLTGTQQISEEWY